MVEQTLINGVYVRELSWKAAELKDHPDLAQFEFAVDNKWLDCCAGD